MTPFMVVFYVALEMNLCVLLYLACRQWYWVTEIIHTSQQNEIVLTLW